MNELPRNARLESADLDARREHAIDALTTAFADNSISVEEYEASVGRLNGVRTIVEIDGILSQLPRSQDTAVETVVSRDPVREEKIVCNGSSRKIAGGILLAPRLSVELAHGVLRLDYSGLRIPRGIYEVSLKAIHSSCTILLPEGVEIDNRVDLRYSSLREPRSPANRNSSGVVLRLSGELVHSTLKVRRPVNRKWSFFWRLK
jgi:hypothetical protein